MSIIIKYDKLLEVLTQIINKHVLLIIQVVFITYLLISILYLLTSFCLLLLPLQNKQKVHFILLSKLLLNKVLNYFYNLIYF